MVDFFYIVGAPESEIDRLNDIGALLNPKTIGSWIEVSNSDGMDGGWFFKNQTPISFTLAALDFGDPVSLIRDWANKHNITHSIYLSRGIAIFTHYPIPFNKKFRCRSRTAKTNRNKIQIDWE